MTGWECPKCHRCYAPTVTECATCNAGVTTVPVTQPVCVPVVVPQTGRPYPQWWPDVWCGQNTTNTLTWPASRTVTTRKSDTLTMRVTTRSPQMNGSATA